MRVTFAFNKGKVLSSLRAYNEKLDQATRQGAKEAVERAQRLAKDYVPEDTGMLSDSIRIQRIGDRPSRMGFRLIVGDDELVEHPEYPMRMVRTADYARLVHENYWSQVATAPSPITQQKIALWGAERVTGGFLRWAMKDAVEQFEKELRHDVNKARLGIK